MTTGPAPAAAVCEYTRDGATLVAETTGEGATAFVLVHGIGMGRSVFADLADRLADHGRVVAVDLPGYGEAPEPPRTPTIERMADHVAAYLADRVPGRVVVVGHSMGAQVAVEIAARHPGAVSAVVLAAPTVDPRARGALRQLALLTLDVLGESPKVILAGAREYLRAGPNMRRKLRAMLAHRPEDAFGRVGAPTLVLRGERDLVCSRRWCTEVAAALPRGSFEEIPGRGHETMIRDGREPAARIVAFARSSAR